MNDRAQRAGRHDPEGHAGPLVAPLSPIVPRGSVAGRALTSVVAIMTFLACLTLGAVSLVQHTAATWQSQISHEATIQIRPVDGADMKRAQAGKCRSRQAFRA